MANSTIDAGDVNDLLQRLGGRHYTGETKDQLPHGDGELRFPDGLIYRGSFYEGLFHGAATIHFPNGGSFSTHWHLNILQSATYSYPDGLTYPTLTSPTSSPASAFTFCTDADRRYLSELKRGITLAPLGESQLTDRPGRSVPYQCYDVGDGYLEPESGTVWGWESRSVIRRAEQVEIEWAKNKCRVGRDSRFPHIPLSD